jgi:hypothetical protein
MCPTDDVSASLQWLVQGGDVASGSLFNHIAGDPNVRQIQRVAPDIVVLSMSPDHAARLRTRFGSRLVIEPNRDLIPPA